MHRTTGGRSLLALAAALLFLAFSSTPEAVLCVAGDHHAIEVIAGMDCHPGSKFPFGLANASHRFDDGCPPGCTDTPLNSGSALRASKRAAPANPAFFPIAPFPPRECLLRFDRGLFAGLSTSPPLLTPGVLRTTVLLC